MTPYVGSLLRECSPRGIACVEAGFGGLELLVNAAGVGYRARVEALEPAPLRALFALNVEALLFCCRHALPLLERGHAPVVVNVSSVVGRRGIPGQVAYAATKAAVNSIGEGLRVEWAERGVAVCTLEPGLTRTGFFDAQPNPYGLSHPALAASEEPEHVFRAVLDLARRPRPVLWPDGTAWIVNRIDNPCRGPQAPDMIARDLGGPLLELAGQYPVVTVTGPRQSGKTTLCRSAFPDRPYVSLEALDVREAAREDPRGFLGELRGGAVIDEFQHVPELASYLQVEVDEDPEPGRFVLTGSQHFGLTQAVSQSLAGRTAVLHLYPPSLAELRRFDAPPTGLVETLWTGAYPRIHERGIPAGRWLADYVATYVQRDVRQLLNVGDLETFTRFVRHCAGRTARELNLSALGSDVGVSHNTVRAWLSVLEASFLVILVPSWQRNLRKQLVKAPKLHFVDSGLACHLLGIASPDQLRHHPLRGEIFESWVAAEILKSRAHRGLAPRLHHFRDAKGLEVDLVVEGEDATSLVEVKAGATLHSDFFSPLGKLARLVAERQDWKPVRELLVYGGDRAQSRTRARAIPWGELDAERW